MARFEELQQLWQQQGERAFPRRDAAELSNAFRRYGRRNDLIGTAKILIIACQLYFIVTVFRHRPTMLLGACLIDFSALYFMLCDWRNQRAIARLNFAESSMQFVREAIARLHAQRDPFRTRDFYIALAGFWTGGLIILASRWHPNFADNLPFAAATLGSPFLAFAFGRWIRRVRFKRECQPLIDRLEQVLATMQDTEFDRI